MKMYSEIGRRSAGPREAKRTLDRGEVLARREIVMRQLPCPERTAALTKIREQLRTIGERVSA